MKMNTVEIGETIGTDMGSDKSLQPNTADVKSRSKFSLYLSILTEVLNPNSVLHLMARVLPGGFSVRPFLHRLRGVKIGENVWIGDDVYLDEKCPEGVEIQEGVAIATRCTLISHTKGRGKIIIERNAAIGAGCIIICATDQTLTIGEGSVISAGSTVTHDIPPRTLCGAPRLRIYGKVSVPFRIAKDYAEFRRGIKPIRAENNREQS
jgi:acetyltransferase-like isoleucine patch superfamily enzyme